MGADGYARTFFGVEVRRGDFFQPAGTVVQCPEGHKPEKPGKKFCSDCGGVFKELRMEQASPTFTTWSKKMGYDDPKACWGDLCGEGLGAADEWDVVYVKDVAAITSSERDEPGFLALGFELADQGGERRGHETVNAVSWLDLQDKADHLRILANEVGIPVDREAKIFTSYYWSV